MRGVSSQASWNFLSENAGTNALDQEGFAIVLGFRAPVNALTGISRIFDFWWIDVYSEQGVFSIKDVNGNRNSTGLVVVPTKDYILTIRRVDTSGNGTYMLSPIPIFEPTRRYATSYAVSCSIKKLVFRYLLDKNNNST